MFRRPFRPMRRAVMRPINPADLEAVSRANQLLADGKSTEAAEIFARLGQEFDARGMPRRAAQAHAHAANAFAQSKNEAAGMTHARAALNTFVRLGMTQRAAQFYANITRGLRQSGLNNSADSLQKEFGGSLQSAGEAGNTAQVKRGRLPAKCPHCAGPARSDEVDWIDEFSAECNFCGGVIQTES